MSRPDYEMGKVTVQQLTQIPSEQYPPCGITVANYTTDPDPGTNDPGSIIFNTTSDTLKVARNNKTYVAVASAGTPLSSFAAPTGDIDMSGYALLNAQDPDPTDLTQVVNVGYVLDSTLPSTATLNSIAALNVTTDNINMNNHKITGLSDGVDVLDAVNVQQLTALTTHEYGGVYLNSGTAVGQVMVSGIRARMSDGTYASTAASSGITISGNRITNTSGNSLYVKVSLEASVASTAGGSLCTVFIAKNGSTVDAGNSATLDVLGNSYSLGYSTLITLAANDYIEPFIQSSANDTFTAGDCYFNITRA